MKNNIYVPPLHRTLACTLSFLLLLISSLCSYFSLHTEYPLYFTVFAAFFLIFSFQVFFRFCLTEYVYKLDGGLFYVIRKTGKKETVIFDLSLSLCDEIMTYKDAKKLLKTKNYRIYKRVQSLVPKEKHVIFYEDPRPCAVIIEASSEFMKNFDLH